MSLAKKPSTALSQDAEVGVKWNVQRGCRASHWRTFWMFVGRIIVDDGVDHFSHRDLLLDRIEEVDELLVAMVQHVAADDGAIEDVESCEQRGGAVTFVVVRHRLGAGVTTGLIGPIPAGCGRRAWIWLTAAGFRLWRRLVRERRIRPPGRRRQSGSKRQPA